MDEKDVLKKLDEIKSKRLEYKEAALKNKQEVGCATDPAHSSEAFSREDMTSLSEEEISNRLKEWRENPDPTCEECGICSPDERPDSAD